MASTTPERNQPVLLPAPEPAGLDVEARVQRRTERRVTGQVWAMAFAAALSTFWVGAAVAYLWGYFGPKGLAALPLPTATLFFLGSLLPPFLIVAATWALVRASSMASTAAALAEATDRIFSADETSARTAARLGRAVRRELDALNAGLDGAFARLRALESILEQQIAAIDQAGARMDVRGEAVAARLTQERERIEGVASSLGDAATRASETVAGRSALLKSTIDSAEATLRSAGQSLELQAASFRQAVQSAADAPKVAATEFDAQAKRIESVSDAAVARAEFVLGRQERHRTAMNDLLQRLKDETTGFESALTAQRAAIEQVINALGAEANRFENLTGDTDRRLDVIMANASARATQLAQSYGREVERLKEISEASNAALAKLVDGLREAGSGAQTLIGETTGQAKSDAKALVGEAMAECERLLRAAGEMSIEAGAIRNTLAKAVDTVEHHIMALPSIAQQEAQRVRELVRMETEEMLDLSARTLSTIHARNAAREGQRPSVGPPVVAPPAAIPSEADSLIGMARRFTGRQRRRDDLSNDLRQTENKRWHMSDLLAAAETGSAISKPLKASSAAALGALEAVLSDLAIDLDAISSDGMTDEEWRLYVKGDRAVFARRIAQALDENAVDRIAALYRDDQRFHDAADLYLSEFDGLLARAREADTGGLLASTMLSADTGKIYLAIAYALGRL